MKLKFIVLLSTVSIVTLGSGGSLWIDRSLARAELPTMVSQQTLREGPFVEVEHETAGSARIVIEDGKRYLELDETFQTDEGPDVFVLLHRETLPESYSENDYINLGELQKLSGSQRYEIPEAVDLSEYSSAVIWCRQFKATFGYASLNEVEMPGAETTPFVPPMPVPPGINRESGIR